MRMAIALLLTAVFVPQAAAEPPSGMTRAPARVRPLDSLGRTLLADGIARSSTFRRLVDRIESSDVIVYVRLKRKLLPNVAGALSFVGKGATDRFLLVQVDRRYPWATLIALLGHELQHAVEVAEAPAVESAEELGRHYRHTGLTTGDDTFDSVAAREAGASVLAELYGGNGADVRQARARASRGGALLESGNGPKPWRD